MQILFFTWRKYKKKTTKNNEIFKTTTTNKEKMKW